MLSNPALDLRLQSIWVGQQFVGPWVNITSAGTALAQNGSIDCAVSDADVTTVITVRLPKA